MTIQKETLKITIENETLSIKTHRMTFQKGTQHNNKKCDNQYNTQHNN
jgi:hypothetical protein